MKGDFGPQKAGDAPFDLTLHTFESGLPDFGAFPDDPSPDPNDIAQASSGTGSRPAQMKVSDWNEVLVNNNLLNGFFIDQETEELFRARKTAFKLEPNPINSFLFSPGTLSSVLKSQIKAKAQKIVTELPLVSKVELDVRSPSLGSAMKVGLASDHDSTAGSDVGSDAGDQTSSQVSTVGSDPGDPSLPAGVPLDNLYPLWEICDDSRIRIQAISSQLQLASAQQGFSSADVKAAVDASTLSIGASASAGFATSSKSASSSTTGKATTQMHASYDFPRVRLFLDEDWISLSPDCTAALAGIKQIKSYKEVLEFYNAFGHLFVTRTKLGGCLRAIQHLTQAQQSAMGSTEDEFKASLAASFSTATASGSASSVVEKGSSSESKSASSNMNSSIAWEAQGGDTTLGNNPSLWCTTVDNSWFWRVVEQEAVAPIEYIISKIPGHEDTKALFAGILLNHLMETTPMEIPWNGASGVALGSGISSCCIVTEPSDILRQSALEVSAPVNKAISSTPDVHWHVVYDKLSMQSYLRQSFLQTVNALVGTRLYPNLVWRLGCSERAFSVVLTLRSGMVRSTATFTVPTSTTSVTDPTTWKTTLGDFYVRSTVKGTALSVCWTFVSQTRSAELERAQNTVAALLSTPTTSFEVGCKFLARLGMNFPCQVYFYDAYYQETILSSPADVIATIQQQQQSASAQQVVSVVLEPYINIEALQKVAASTVSSPVPSGALEVIREDEAAYVYEASKWQPDISIVSLSNPSFTTWQGNFSSTTYNSTVQSPSGAITAATGLVQNYNNLFSRATEVVVPQSPVWPVVYGTTAVLQATLEWLRQSRKQELETLSQPVSTTNNTTFGLSSQPNPLPATTSATPPAAPPATAPPPPSVPVYSLRAAYSKAGLEAIMDTGDSVHSIDEMWSYVTTASEYATLSLPAPAVVVAYEMVPTGSGSSPVMIRPQSVVQLNVGTNLTEFANTRTQASIATPGLAVYEVWVVNGTLRYSDIAS